MIRISINAGLYQMLVNALQRDAEEGKKSRKEMLEELTKDASLVAAPVVPDESTISRVGDAVAEALGNCAYDCTRVWSAWGYGTMSQDDFVLIADDSDRVTEIAQAAIDAMLKGDK